MIALIKSMLVVTKISLYFQYLLIPTQQININVKPTPANI
ncbi:unnamed protein product [Paramecium octaurelia]|uniref:Uncharacterized protein n=1 Tax=Paramecium octaurelia TaxID=43137 RepID=A0A8S1TPP7_PAROT|nr:unnamed protein product [Paramecium octaurelia]